MLLFVAEAPANQPVVLVPYDTDWPRRFTQVSDEMRRACGARIMRIEHIGSTSVPGLGAKAVIDVMPGLARFEDGNDCVEPLRALGYRYLGENGIAGRHFFVRGAPRTENVHMYAVGADEWLRHLLFRDFLRASAETRERYWALKQELARRFPDDVNAYAAAKSDFVAEVLSRAAAR